MSDVLNYMARSLMRLGMMQRVYVGITDSDWAEFLFKNINIVGDEINFWVPGGRNFKALEFGDLFLFKRHARKNKGENGEIIGGAYFDHFERVPLNELWKKYGLNNGVISEEVLKERLGYYRDRNNLDCSYEVGCIILRNVFWFDKKYWIESPSDWKSYIVSGKLYTADTENGKILIDEVKKRLHK